MQKNQISKSNFKNKIKHIDKKIFFSFFLKFYNFCRKFNKRKFNIKPVSSNYGFYINDYLKKDNLLTQLCEKYIIQIKVVIIIHFIMLETITQINILKFLKIKYLIIVKFLNVGLDQIIHF